MRNSTKLKMILKENTIGISYGDEGWHISIVRNDKPQHRIQVNGKSFSAVINAAFRSFTSQKK